MTQRIMPVVVSFRTLRWIRVALRSFHRHFPEETVLVVDNNPARGEPGWEPAGDEERAWLQEYAGVTLIANESTDKSHGAGIDTAVACCREQGVEFLLHFEPDCLISGTRWYVELLHALGARGWMAGSHRKVYGPIHPTPSVWRVAAIPGSFCAQPRGDDQEHPRFRELFDLECLETGVRREGGDWEFFRSRWDTGQKNWFQAALQGRAALAAEVSDFQHFWFGSTLADHPALVANPQVAELSG